MAGQGTLILASDYNGIQSKINGILGVGSGTSGYGQTISSAQVSVNDPIRASQWTALRNDLLRARQHQTGADESGNLTVINAGETVASNSIEVEYNNFSDVVIANKLTVAGSQGSTSELIASSRNGDSVGPWNGILSNQITVSFSDANHARYFFNAGGNFQITSSRSGTVSSSKDSTWTTMLSQSGVVTMNYTTTTTSNLGSAYNIGFYSLTTTDQLIFQKTAPSGSYSENLYEIYAKTNGTASQVIFTVYYKDLDVGDDQIADGYDFKVDENVYGTLSCSLQMFRPSGSNVSVASPSASQTGL
jgi:hypothetical protein